MKYLWLFCLMMFFVVSVYVVLRFVVVRASFVDVVVREFSCCIVFVYVVFVSVFVIFCE